MPDLNEWILDVPTKVPFGFGSIGTSDYPLGVQVDIGDVDSDLQDQAHPTSDGVVMGKDTLAGFELTYTIKILPDMEATVKADVALDLFSAFRAAWRADPIRRTPGAYATVTNVLRDRLVYGRPRKCAPKMDRLRRGLVEYVATFDTNSPNWYSATEHSTNLPIVPPLTGYITSPVQTPVTTASESAPTIDSVVNAGDVDAWGILKINGPISGAAVSLIEPDLNLFPNPSFTDLDPDTGIFATTSCSLARITSLFRTTPASMEVTATGAALVAFATGETHMAVEGKRAYTSFVYCRGQVARTFRMALDWYDVDHNFISRSWGAAAATGTGAWGTQLTSTATSPANAVWLSTHVEQTATNGNSASGEKHYFDDFSVKPVSPKTLWKITLPTALKVGQVLTIDTRPWARSAILGTSTPANGRLRGSQIEDCSIPPGPWRLRLDGIDPSGVASVLFKWRDAFASM